MKIEELRTIEGKVNYLLIKYKETRDSDTKLFAKYVQVFAPEYYSKPFEEVFTNADIPSFESIGRLRRKLQATFEELRGSERAQKSKKECEEVFKEYAKE